MKEINEINEGGTEPMQFLSCMLCAKWGIHMNEKYFHNVRSVIRLPDGTESGYLPLKITQGWEGNVYKSKLMNSSTEAISIKEAVLFSGTLDLASETKLYGEGLSMLS